MFPVKVCMFILFQMLVEDQDGQKLVVVNPGPGEEPQTIVVPEQVTITGRLFISRHYWFCDWSG